MTLILKQKLWGKSLTGMKKALGIVALALCLGAFAGQGGKAYAATVPVTEVVGLTSCSTDGKEVTVTGANSGAITGDGWFYLFELQPYEDSIGSRTDYLAAAAKQNSFSFVIPLQNGRIYNKFVVAVWNGERYVQVSQQAYITNPETVAKNQQAFKTPLTKKGLLIQTDMISDAFSLGVKHVIINIPFQLILGSGIDYEYEGKTYHFNKSLMEHYDKVVSSMSGKDLSVTAVILNSCNDATPDLYYPGTTKQNGVNYYMFNTSTKAGYEDTKAIASFLAERYGGTGHGVVSNWVIGNEINNQTWNYIGPMGIDQYVKEYERAFRVFYTAIKSTSANDRVYFSTDYNWMLAANGKTSYNAKEVIDKFAANVVAGGNIDWNLAYHPYSVPATEPEFWDDFSTGYVNWEENSPIVNIANLSVLTDYLQKPQLLDRSGKVRHVILSEQGFTSVTPTRGSREDLQAAAIAYAYYIADSNPYIDAFIMSRQVDAPSEVADYLSLGLYEGKLTPDNQIQATRMKLSYDVYKDIDKGAKTLKATNFAKEIIGIKNWYDVIPNFKWKGKELGH